MTSGRWLPRTLPFALLTLVLALPARVQAGTGVPDDQWWSELDLGGNLDRRFSLTGIMQLRLSATLENPSLTASGLDFNYKHDDWTLGLGYRHQVTGNRVRSNPNVTQEALFVASYMHRFGQNTLSIRSRFENTITASSNPWRERLRGEYRRGLREAWRFSYLFINDEGFYQFSNNQWFRNRLEVGTDVTLTRAADMRLYYMRQDSRNSTPGAINALGITFAVQF